LSGSASSHAAYSACSSTAEATVSFQRWIRFCQSSRPASIILVR
jgi:hypothetical protein